MNDRPFFEVEVEYKTVNQCTGNPYSSTLTVYIASPASNWEIRRAVHKAIPDVTTFHVKSIRCGSKEAIAPPWMISDQGEQ